MAGYFPENAVDYFVSHYDYYQPEAYLAKRDLSSTKNFRLTKELNRSVLLRLLPRPRSLTASLFHRFRASTD